MSYNHNFKKNYGQNFLKSDKIAKQISLAISHISNILEIGPGKGMLTEVLLEDFDQVYASEIDRELYDYLELRFEDKSNFELIKKDILQFDISNLNLDQYSVTGNLPYNISKKIIKKFLESENKPKEIVILLQKEVAKKYTAKPPNASYLSNFAQIYSYVEYLFTVNKKQFYPEPKVDGAVLRFVVKDKDVIYNEPYKLSKFIRNGFRSPRKTLVNVLNSIYKVDKEVLNEFILSLKRYTKKARAQEIFLEDWIRIYEFVSKKTTKT